ncbi:MAG: hypothetical protein V2B15_08715 [Bacteroidota bacterium]
MNDNQSYLFCGVLLRPSKPWQIKVFGFPPEAMGDCLFLMGETMNPDYLYTILTLLKHRKRWPDVLQILHQDHIAKNRLEKWWSRLWWELSRDEKGESDQTRLYGPQTAMSRDPFMAYFASCVHNNRRDMIEKLTIPWYLYRPNVWTWRRYLITLDEKDLKRYLFWEKLLIKSSRREYAANLVRIRANAAGVPEILELMPTPKPNKG